MQPIELPAKSKRPGEAQALSLQQHLQETEKAAHLLFSDGHRFGLNFRRFFRIADADHERFLWHVCLASLLHDLGKANEDFIAAVNGSGKTQLLRHEHLSALILHLPVIRSWLQQQAAVDWDVVTAAVLTHHLKADRSGDYPWGQAQGLGQSVRLHLSHPQMQRILERLAELAKLPPPPAMPVTTYRVNDAQWQQALQAGMDAANDLEDDLLKAAESDAASMRRRALLAAVKAGVIAADAAASGLVRTGHPIQHWITSICAQPAITADELYDKIIRPRLDFIGKRSQRPAELQPFQCEVAERGARVLLLSGCGTGKTLAAWNWARAQAQTRAFGRVLFLYPTRGTATEGFRDYVSWAPETEATLLSGTAAYELDEIRRNPTDSTRDKNFETDGRLFALGLWSRRFFSSTVDQFLAFLENHYKALCLVPVLADSVVILDEVHSYDPHMFHLVCSFLKELDVPVLCMTATLSPSRTKDLTESVGLVQFPRDESSLATQTLRIQESQPRYRHIPLSGSQAALDAARRAYQDGLRVLWVVNQVRRCQDIAQQLQTLFGTSVLCYHSRFRLCDRRERHDATVAAFAFSGGDTPCAMAVTTQVCEMSLDLDADVLITEWAPISALVQRFGRANRHGKRGPDFRATLHTYRPDHALPYRDADLQAAHSFLAALSGEDISQRELADKLLFHSPEEGSLSQGSARFLSGGYFAVPGQFRDGDDFTMSCIVSDDVGEARRRHVQRAPLDPLLIPVPRSSPGLLALDARPDFLPRHIGVADGTYYSPTLGFLSARSL